MNRADVRLQLRRQLRRATLAAASVAGAAFGFLPSTAIGATSAPISIDVVYQARPTPDAPCGGFRVTGAGIASGPPVGTAAWSDHECASLLARPGKVTITGEFVMATAGGDQLSGSYVAVADPPEADGTIRPRGTFTVTGGTGRFSGSTGGGEISAVANVLRPEAVAHLEGSLID